MLNNVFKIGEVLFKGGMTHLQNIVGKSLEKYKKVTVTWNYSLWWQNSMKLVNSFDWQIYNFLLKESVQMFIANKEIKRKSGSHFCSLFLN